MTRDILLVAHAVACAGLALVRPAGAAEPLAPAAAYRSECGSCHVAYPRGLLAARDWSRVLAGLDRHYGVDASVDAGARSAIARYLGATTVAAGDGATPRITAQPWFVREHAEAGDLRARVAPRAGGTGARLSQCDACHAGAAAGRFEEDER
jgi:cytochrome c5